MANKLVNIRIPRELYADCEAIIKELRFSNIQDFVKDSIRKAVMEYRRREGIRWLEENFGKSKPVKRLTRAQKEKIALEHTPEISAEIARRFFHN